MKKEITWKTGDGREVVFSVELVTEEVIGRDAIAGDIKKRCCELRYGATVAGNGISALGSPDVFGTPRMVGSVKVVAAFGPLGISDENYNRILAAVEEIKSGEYWTEWQLKVNAAYEMEDNYRMHTDRVDRMIGKGWSE